MPDTFKTHAGATIALADIGAVVSHADGRLEIVMRGGKKHLLAAAEASAAIAALKARNSRPPARPARPKPKPGKL